MLIKILTHTPIYVWAILGLLVYRGMVAARDREVGVRKLFIIPVLMLALSLQGIVARFGVNTLPLAAWGAGLAAMTLLIWIFGRARVSAGVAPGTVRVQGSWAPLTMMMAIFFAKYALAVTLAIAPQLAQHDLFTVAMCTVFGVFSGYFLGRLASDVAAYQALKMPYAPTAA
jgi:hypothetical protein